MKTQFAYIFITRNFGDGYGYAYPRMNLLRNWFIRKFLLPKADREMGTIESRLESTGTLIPKLAEGLAAWSMRFKHTIYKFKIAPDKEAEMLDPRATGRSPRFETYVVLEGNLSPWGKKFDDFIEHCLDVAKRTKQSGESSALTINIPTELYIPNNP